MRKIILISAAVTAALLSSCSGKNTVSSSSSPDEIHIVSATMASEADENILTGTAVSSAKVTTTITTATANAATTENTNSSKTSIGEIENPDKKTGSGCMASPDETETQNIKNNSAPSSTGTASAGSPVPRAASSPAGVDISRFTSELAGISVSSDSRKIYQSGSVRGYQFSLTIDLSKWAGNTSIEQIVTASQLFWECYPRMYARFGSVSNAPRDVVLAIENEGYSPAYTSGSFVHIHDEWLRDNPTDYDCLTHEFAHVIQNGWDEEFCESGDFIERFADFCRFEYAFRNGLYNDSCWTLLSPDYEGSVADSNRFYVWLDYVYSTPANDIMLKFFEVCYEEKYPSYQWDKAWQEIFSGSQLEGRSIGEVWDEFAASDFAYLSSDSSYGPSELLSNYDIRSKIA